LPYIIRKQKIIISTLTNIAPDILNVSEIAAVYAARWEVELIFKELKSRYELDQITTKSPYAIEEP